MDTELHYVTYDPDAIWEAMQLSYVEAGGDALRPGDEKEMLLRSVLADIVQVFAGVDQALRMMTLRYAVGDYLDMIGDQRGCGRITASAASATVTITANQTGLATVLPAGSAMTADGEIFWLLTEDVALTGYHQTVTVTVMADRTGSAGNSLTAGTPLTMAKHEGAVNSVVAASDASGGNDGEDDETYRERIRVFLLSAVTTGPAQQYEAAARAVSDTILDAKAICLSAGQVGVYLLLSDQSGAAGILQAVEDALSASDTRPLTDTVTVAQATDISYSLDVTCQTDGSVSGTALANAVKEYQDWQDNAIGRAFNPDRLIALLYQAGVTRAVIEDTSTFDGETGDVGYTEIDPNERCTGTVSLTVS